MSKRNKLNFDVELAACYDPQRETKRKKSYEVVMPEKKGFKDDIEQDSSICEGIELEASERINY